MYFLNYLDGMVLLTPFTPHTIGWNFRSKRWLWIDISIIYINKWWSFSRHIWSSSAFWCNCIVIRRQKFIPKIPHDIIIGSGVAAAISAGFGAPLAGIIFAHETVLRHFSKKAVAALAISSMAANFSATEIGIVSSPLLTAILLI